MDTGRDIAVSTTRRGLLGGAVVAAVAGCLGSLNDDQMDGAADGGTGAPDDADDPASDDVLDADPRAFRDILEEPTVPLAASLDEFADAAANSAAPKDGIPAISDPDMVEPDADILRLDDHSVIFGVNIDGVARAYPRRVLVWHEIVNDVIGDDGYAITYCPLTGTTIGYERGDARFGVEGWLINSNLILFDRGTDSWWPQILGTAVDGEFTGWSLPEFRVIRTTWGRWKERYPDTTVLSEDTGFARDYGNDVYGDYDPQDPTGYYDDEVIPFPVMHEDDRLSTKHIVMGARTGDGAVAFSKDLLRADRRLTADLAGRTYLAVYDSDLDTAFVYREPADGSQDLDGPDAVDIDGERYVFGDATYAAAELPLESVNVFDALWFAWAAFYPDTELVA